MEKLTNTGANSQQLLAWLPVCLLAERSSHLHEVKIGSWDQSLLFRLQGKPAPQPSPRPLGG